LRDAEVARIDAADGLLQSIDPYAAGLALAEVDGLRARRFRAEPGRAVPWHEKTESTTLFFCHSESIAIEIRKPPYRCVLEPGQTYQVPAGVAMTMYAMTDRAAECTVFEFGGRLDAYASKKPELGFFFDRMEVEAELPLFSETSDYAGFSPGFSRMDVVASPVGLRLIVQGHGPSQCVPWHSHDRISDSFFCMKGRVRIATREPDGVIELPPGGFFTVAAGVAHFVSGARGQPCQMLVLQGVGTYNYVSR
jgi:quercetin dioxygenase-like cupin family protein